MFDVYPQSGTSLFPCLLDWDGISRTPIVEGNLVGLLRSSTENVCSRGSFACPHDSSS